MTLQYWFMFPIAMLIATIAMALGVGGAAGECLVIEDSHSRVKAALAAGKHVVAVSMPFTREGLRRAGLLPSGHIVEDPTDLTQVVEHVVSQHAAGAVDQEPAPNQEGLRA
jgi:beta-phosphoglucomutase-like phosphatase (HAD superfamily)